MKTLRFQRRTRIAAPADAVFAWHARPGSLERLVAPWERVAVEERTGGHPVTRLVRGTAAGPDETAWDSARALVDTSRVDGVDAIVDLAGENIAAGRWTPARKAEIRRSRVDGTRTLCAVLARLPHPPTVLVSASAVGFYGDRGDEILTEESGPGTGFLTDVCRGWEAATEPTSRAGIRVVNLRFGMVLSSRGGALHKLLFPFQLGLGGRIGCRFSPHRRTLAALPARAQGTLAAHAGDARPHLYSPEELETAGASGSTAAPGASARCSARCATRRSPGWRRRPTSRVTSIG